MASDHGVFKSRFPREHSLTNQALPQIPFDDLEHLASPVGPFLPRTRERCAQLKDPPTRTVMPAPTQFCPNAVRKY